ncbi:MAG: hypothetical protein R6X05_03000, partial [Desulfobacterales bacterium]
MVLLSGLLYTLGRTVSYFAVAFIAVKSLISVPSVSMFLQSRMNQFLGPILLIVGVTAPANRQRQLILSHQDNGFTQHLAQNHFFDLCRLQGVR